MASKGVTGWLPEKIEQRRQEYRELHSDDDAPPFDEVFCLAKIPVQPDDYDGPDRYCMKADTRQIGDSYHCKYHGGAGHANPENLDKLAPMKSGMKALDKHLRQDFTEKDRKLYDWVVDTFADAYDIDPEANPSDAYDLHRLAVEMVRAERGRGQLIEEGEVREDPVRNEEGQLVTDSQGNVVTEKSEHYLASMMKQQDSKITQFEKELGISRKERLRRDTTEDAVEAVKNFAELGSAFIERDEKEYDPEDRPWSKDDEDEDQD